METNVFFEIVQVYPLMSYNFEWVMFHFCLSVYLSVKDITFEPFT